MTIVDMEAHYNLYQTLPREAMEELFAAAKAQATALVVIEVPKKRAPSKEA